jgi:hypothetical protein
MTRKTKPTLAAIAGFVLVGEAIVSCSGASSSKYDEGFADGFDKGRSEGINAGREEGKDEFEGCFSDCVRRDGDDGVDELVSCVKRECS